MCLTYSLHYKLLILAGEMAQEFPRALAALPEDLGSFFNTHVVAHNSSRRSDTLTPMYINKIVGEKVVDILMKMNISLDPFVLRCKDWKKVECDGLHLQFQHMGGLKLGSSSAFIS